jgi:insertion element IS1 protein InsB
MKQIRSTCIKPVVQQKICLKCENHMTKHGKSGEDNQRYRCKKCNYTQVEEYRYKSYCATVNSDIKLLTKEGCGIRSIGRILGISPMTVIRRVVSIANELKRPFTVVKGRKYQVDELFTYIGNKKRRRCIAYSLEVETGNVIGFVVGSRNKTNLNKVISTLLLSDAKKITTDKLNIYKELIPKAIHSTKFRGINKIERNNLSLRTHLKRLNRRSICYSKSIVVLSAILKIYFWG